VQRCSDARQKNINAKGNENLRPAAVLAPASRLFTLLALLLVVRVYHLPSIQQPNNPSITATIMSTIRPLIAIKAGKCHRDGDTVIPSPEAGLLYIYANPEEELLHHFCWKPRGVVEPEDDLLIFPGDARLIRYDTGPTGRIFMLKFLSSSQRNFYWLQSLSEDPDQPGLWSERDKGWIKKIDDILQGEEAADDEEMGDAPIDSTEIEQEGEQPRRGGEDGGRAFATPQFDLSSLISQIRVPSGSARQQEPPISLHHLLGPGETVGLIDNASSEAIDNMISNLPPSLVPENASEGQKKQIIARVLRSPQFAQGVISLSAALREGALRGVAESLKIPIVPGEEATEDQVEAFVRGIKRGIEREQ